MFNIIASDTFQPAQYKLTIKNFSSRLWQTISLETTTVQMPFNKIQKYKKKFTTNIIKYAIVN